MQLPAAQELQLSADGERLLAAAGHLLVLGGPGSGKTTIALLKAEREIQGGALLPGQQVLFLSFARATIARVAEQAGKLIDAPGLRALEINTYHGFAWCLLRAHGYLLNPAPYLRLLPPPEAAARLSEVSGANRETEKLRLLHEEGLLHFDLFAACCTELLARSKAIARIICDAYPIVILDEFQDTNEDEWQMIQVLGERSRLIALADPEQRIYEFRGADPRRIDQLIAAYSPLQFDFGCENRRSDGKDIVAFGNDLLSGANKKRSYSDVEVVRYQPLRKVGGHLALKTKVISGRERLRKAGQKTWSIAVLVPTKQLMLEVSDYFGSEQTFSGGKRLPSLTHDVALDSEGPALAAILIAGLLEMHETNAATAQRLLHDLCLHVRGRKGTQGPASKDLVLASALENYLSTGAIRGTVRREIVDECERISRDLHRLVLTGDPGDDWLAVRALLEESSAPIFGTVAEDAKYLRLLRRGAVLRSTLSELWRLNGGYTGAPTAVRNALLQEHFLAPTRPWHGINIMTIHRSKGKEFDEVFVFEGCHYRGRIVRYGASPADTAQAHLALRVAVTRARKRATILTPCNDACPLL